MKLSPIALGRAEAPVSKPMKEWKIKPCPHCGDTRQGRHDQDGIEVRVICWNCNALGPPGTTIVEATFNWNKREGGTVMTADGPATVIGGGS